jgi:hypothetical protein
MEYTWTNWKAKRLEESRGQQPNYSFDSWLQKTKDLGDEISSFVGDAKQKDAELDKEKKSSKPDNLRNIAKERNQEATEEESKKSSGSAKKSSKPQSTTPK